MLQGEMLWLGKLLCIQDSISNLITVSKFHAFWFQSSAPGRSPSRNLYLGSPVKKESPSVKSPAIARYTFKAERKRVAIFHSISTTKTSFRPEAKYWLQQLVFSHLLELHSLAQAAGYHFRISISCYEILIQLYGAEENIALLFSNLIKEIKSLELGKIELSLPKVHFSRTCSQCHSTGFQAKPLSRSSF